MEFLPALTLSFVATESALTAYKLWRRKHKIDVAQSISLFARGVSLITIGIFMVDSYQNGHLTGIVSGIIWLAVVLLQTAIALGFWIDDFATETPLNRLRHFLRREADEFVSPLTRLLRPADKTALAHILIDLARIDGMINHGEQHLIQGLAERWGISIDWQRELAQSATGNPLEAYLDLRHDMRQYLATDPPAGQARYLADLIQTLVASDGSVSQEELAIARELMAMLRRHHRRNSVQEQGAYQVVVIPQHADQWQQIHEIAPSMESSQRDYGRLVTSGVLHTPDMAQYLCQKVRAQGIPAMVVAADHI